MKEKLIFAVVMAGTALPVLAGGADSTQPLPEPSTLGLFAAAAIAVTVLAKLRK